MASGKERGKLVSRVTLAAERELTGSLRRGNGPPAAAGKIHYAEIFSSSDRNFASHMLLASPGRFSRFWETRGLAPMPWIAEMPATLGPVVKTSLTSQFSKSILPGGWQSKADTPLVDFEIRRGA